MYENASPFSLAFTTQPPAYQKGSDILAIDPDGVSECLLYAPTKRFIMSQPNYPEKIHCPVTKSYEIRELPGRGKGVVALQDIQAGELILAERPLIICSAATMFSELPAGTTAVPGVVNDALARYETLVDRMDSSRKADFMALVNSHEHDGSGPYLGRIRTNAFMVTFDGNNGANSYTSKYGVVGKDISRANHSCCPNASHSFHKPSLSMELRALRKIAKGEEITVLYLNADWQTTAERQKSLSPYGFKCTCPLCLKPDVSDRLFATLCPLDLKIPDIPPVIDVAFEPIQLVEEWHLEVYEIYATYLVHLAGGYFNLGPEEKLIETVYKTFRNVLARRGRARAVAYINEQIGLLPKHRSVLASWLNFV
ncbi:hypothetical protein C8Q75DRAFT_310725 [Abortiporus biennis]|nr:hypothetical protein C8Q75DRAFT_310725 [Abortiporus biennis]